MSEETTKKAVKPSDWFMYHGGYGHGGHATGSNITSESIKAGDFGFLASIETAGSILSVPAIVDGAIYVGLANSRAAVGSNGGTFSKYDITTGKKMVADFTWSIEVDQRDVHGFTGMGCTPTVINGLVYFVGFDAVLYCLNADTLELNWKTDLRHADPDKNQPITNIGGKNGIERGVPAEGWSSPLVIETNGKPQVILGIGEGENPFLMSFIFCLDATTGIVDWVYCTCQFVEGQPNKVNHIPSEVINNSIELPAPFTEYTGTVFMQGTSVWSAIAYDEETGLIYAGTGQPALPSDLIPVEKAPGHGADKGLPTPGWTSGILALKAATGEFSAFTQMPHETSYRPTDFDVDIGSAPTVYRLPAGKYPSRKVVGIGCKNGGFMLCDATTMGLITSRTLLPHYNDNPSTPKQLWKQIPTVDMHPAEGNNDNPTNKESNETWGENFSGPFNTAAVDPATGTLFVGIGGPNYHSASPGIDYLNTPFMRAIKWDSLDDAWPMTVADDSNPRRYTNVGDSMYTTPGESGISSPAVVNDVVFMTTTKVGIHAFNTADGTLLWSDVIGSQTGGMQGGYGYCLGAAIYDKYVVAGALVAGETGGVLNIYGLLSEKGNYPT